MAIALSDALVWWDFTDASGSTVTDASGNGYDGTLVGSPTWVATGPANSSGGVDFNGSSQRMTSSLDLTAGGGGDRTIAIWCNCDALSGQEDLWMDGLGGTQYSQWAYWYSTYPGTNFAWTVATTAGVRTLEAAVPFTSLVHLMVIWNNSARTAYLYLNNVQVASNLALPGEMRSTGAGTVGLASSTTPSNYYNGKIYQYIAFNRSLDATERAEVYNSGAGMAAPSGAGGAGAGAFASNLNLLGVG